MPMKRTGFILSVVILILSNVICAQNKIVLTTGTSSNWAITKTNQPYPTKTLPPNTPWLIDKSSGLIDNTWTFDVQLANLASTQVSLVNQVGNSAKAIWIASDLCDHVDNSVEPQTYNFRNTFFIEECVDITSALIRYTADNSCRIYINGVQIVSQSGLYQYEGSSMVCTYSCGKLVNQNSVNPPAENFNCRGFNKIEIADIAHLLVSGTNVIAVENLNSGGCGTNYGWICINMEIEMDPTDVNLAISDKLNSTCEHEGSFSVLATGGVAPYTFSLNGEESNDGKYGDLKAGNYKVYVKDSKGCKDSINVSIDNQGMPHNILITEIDSLITCEDPEAFVALTSSSGGTIQYSLDNQPLNTANFYNLTPGIHTIYAIDESGCFSDTLELEVTDYKDYVFRNISDHFCPGDSVNILGNYYSLYGQFYDTIKVSSGCDTLFTIQLSPAPLLEKEVAFTICNGEQIVVNGERYNQSGTFEQIIPSATDNCDSLLRINLNVLDEIKTEFTYQICENDSLKIGNIIYSDPGIFDETFVSDRGCDSIVSVRIELRDEEICLRENCGQFFIPNVFSPNNDGINDFFEVSTSNITITYMIIFDRWGGVAYHSNEKNPKWDGFFGRKEAMVGVYAYIIRGYCGSDIPFLRYGDVTLVR